MPLKAINLAPRYGRDYKTAKEAEAAFRAGQDFTANDLSYPQWFGLAANLEDIKALGEVTHVKIRYKRLTEVAIFPL